MINHKHYTYRVTWSAEDNEYLAQCVEFPSLSFLSSKREEALQGMTDLVAEVIKDMESNNEQIPVPFAERKYTGKFQLRIPPALHRELSIQAAEEHVSLNRYISAKL
jgi:predicted HicB family RNase H-like nuclease